MYLLPPLEIIQGFRNQGLSPEEVYRKCEEWAEQRGDPPSPLRRIKGEAPRGRRGWPKGLKRGSSRKPVIRTPTKLRVSPAELYEHYCRTSLQVVAEANGVTRERIRQVLTQAGYDTRLHVQERRPSLTRLQKWSEQNARIAELSQQGLTLKQIGEIVGVTAQVVASRLKQMGIEHVRPPLTPIGCSKCKTDPLARGLCNNCYAKWLKRGKPDIAEQ